MIKRIAREYVLSVDEVQVALWRYLKEGLDQPIPADPKDLAVKWNGPGEAFVSFQESLNISEK